MALANCPRCNRLFNKVKLLVCPGCEAEEEADFEKVRRSLQDEPSQSAEQLSEKTGVSHDCVLRLLAEGRIANVNLEDAVRCGRCGAPAISMTKRLCQKCLNELSVELAAEQSKIQLPPKKKLAVDTPRTVKDVVDEKRKS
jgi:hypothetical protein